MKKRQFLLLCIGASLSISAATAVSAQDNVESRAAEIPQLLAKGHVAWQTKVSSPGASIEAREIGRQGPIVQYHLYASGLPSGEVYELATWPVTQSGPSTLMQGVSLGKDGIVMCAGRTAEQCGDSSKKDDPIEFTFSPAKGEPYRIALVSGDNRAAIVIVPDPITGSDRGCILSVVRLQPEFETAFFTGSGFAPDTEVTLEGRSYDETHPIKTKTDHAGNLQFVILPFVAGHKNGTTVVSGVGTGCSPKVKFDWGVSR